MRRTQRLFHLVGRVAAGEDEPSIQRAVRQHAPTTGELAAHAAFVDGLNDPIWRK